jgi:hypothetical protein
MTFKMLDITCRVRLYLLVLVVCCLLSGGGCKSAGYRFVCRCRWFLLFPGIRVLFVDNLCRLLLNFSFVGAHLSMLSMMGVPTECSALSITCWECVSVQLCL